MIHHQTCSICEALCGLKVELENGEIKSIKGDPDDHLSKGYLCPKGVALQDLHYDKNRLKEPVRKTENGWQKISWEEAMDEVANKIFQCREKYGRRAVGIYAGNPNAHNYSTLLMGSFFYRAVKSKSRFSATSADQLPHMFAGLQMFGHQLLLPVPDLETTDHFIIMGGNPLASNGSLMTAPNMKKRLKDLQKRGGKFIVIDPRKTATAKIADAHYPIKPGTDALFLAAFLNTIFSENLVKPGRWQSFSEGLDLIKKVIKPFDAKKVAAVCGIDAKSIQSMARDFAKTEKAVFYGRLGICTQQFGGLCTWLIHLINIVTNHFDEVGCSMFTHPAVDLVSISALAGEKGHYNAWQSRVRGLPEFGGELPVSTMAEEIDTPGEGQIRSMITIAGNPVLSSPNSERLNKALASLDFMVSVDMYINETSRHAHIILPPVSPLEKDHFGLAFHALAVRNTVKYSQPLFEPGPNTKQDWQILLELAERITLLPGGIKAKLDAAKITSLRKLGPQSIIATALRTGEYGSGLNILKKGISLKKLKQNPNGFDLGPLRPSFPDKLYTPNKKIQMAPRLYLNDMDRLQEWFESAAAQSDKLLLIGRRHLRNNNSWLHNSKRLSGGSHKCTLLIHPKDAEARKIENKSLVKVSSRVGEIKVEAEVSDTMMEGVVSLPHGWGHDLPGVELDVAKQNPGESINKLTDEEFLDPLTGNAGFNGLRVEVSA